MKHNNVLKIVRRIELQRKLTGLTKLLQTQDNETQKKLYNQEADLRWHALLKQQNANIEYYLCEGINMYNNFRKRSRTNDNDQSFSFGSNSLQQEVEMKRQLSFIAWQQNQLQNRLQIITEKKSSKHFIGPLERERIERSKQQLHETIKNSLIFLKNILCEQLNIAVYVYGFITNGYDAISLINQITLILNESTQNHLNI